MSVQYIGRKSFYHGKTLYSIARNFKNFGVGRIVQRYNFFRYAEPSYYVLTKVEPDMTCPKMEKGEAYGIKVFRGENMGEKKIDAGGRRDWRLVPKEDETELIKLAENTPARVKTVIDPVVALPPLMEELLSQEMKNEGIDSPRPIVIKKKIAQTANNFAVLVKGGDFIQRKIDYSEYPFDPVQRNNLQLLGRTMVKKIMYQTLKTRH